MDFSRRGYVIKETGPVYYTKNMDKTAAWFENTLGWYYEIDERDNDGNGQYGCVFDLPKEIETLQRRSQGFICFSANRKVALLRS